MELKVEKLAQAAPQEVMDNPKAFGMPTFAEFMKNRSRWERRADRKFASADRGSTLLSGYVRTQTYEIEGPEGRYRCRSLEEVESVAKKMGLKMEELELIAEVIPETGLKCTLNILFKKKSPILMPGEF